LIFIQAIGQSYVIGDSEMDIKLARRADYKTGIKVGELGGTGDWVTASFRDAEHWLVQQVRESQNC
jgi:histidinol phosphatase-like enzyme